MHEGEGAEGVSRYRGIAKCWTDYYKRKPYCSWSIETQWDSCYL
jgi:hypothetical protein